MRERLAGLGIGGPRRTGGAGRKRWTKDAPDRRPARRTAHGWRERFGAAGAGRGAGTGRWGAAARAERRREREREAERRLAAQRRPPLAGFVRGVLMLAAFACMVGFAVVLAKLTLVPSPSSTALVHANFHPGSSIRAYTDQPAVRDTVKQIGGNILLGVPFGLLLPVVFPRARGLVRVAVVTALVMLCVEAAQGTLVTGRAFDIDDVILNTSGALLGYLVIGRRLGRSVHPRRVHWWQRSRRRTAA